MVIGGQFFLYSDFSNLNPSFFHKVQVKGGSLAGTGQAWNFNYTPANVATANYTPDGSSHNFEIGVPIALRMGNIEYSARIFINTTNVAYAEVATPSAATPLGSRTITVRDPVFAETHVVGLTFDFAGDVHLDVYATGNLTELDQFTA